MSTLVISLVVVGGAIAVVVWLIVGEAPQPATDDDQTDRADDQVSEVDASADLDAAAAPSDQPAADGSGAEEGDAEADPSPKEFETADGTGGLEPVPHEIERDLAPAPPVAAAPSPPARRRRPKPVVVDGPVHESDGDRWIGVSLLHRARSGVALIMIVALVGLAVAAVVGTAAVLISRALESAVK